MSLELEREGTCRACRRPDQILNEDGICKECIEKNQVKMRCHSCSHHWENPGLGRICPICGSTIVGPVTEQVMDWLWCAIAKECGIRYIGMQPGVGRISSTPIFEMIINGNRETFALNPDERVLEGMERKRKQFEMQS